MVDTVRRSCTGAAGSGLVDEVLVVDDGSADATADGGRAGPGPGCCTLPAGGGGKGQAMAAGLAAASGDLVVFLDADVENTTGGVRHRAARAAARRRGRRAGQGLLRRPLHGQSGGGGRVTELMARPVIEVLFPELVDVRQPLAGETAAPRSVLEKVWLAPATGSSSGCWSTWPPGSASGSIAQVDLGVRVHRNRPLDELRPQAVEILKVALERAGLPDRAGTGSTVPEQA